MFQKKIKIPTAKDILLQEFMQPLNISQNELARALQVSPSRINDILKGRRQITADTDLRLCRYFGLSAGYFLRIQMSAELRLAQRNLAAELISIRPRFV